jgi:hypothetical protein
MWVLLLSLYILIDTFRTPAEPIEQGDGDST